MSTMNKTDEALALALTKALETAEATGEFVVAHAPEVVRQLLLFKTISYTLWWLIAAGSLSFGLWLFREGHRASNYHRFSEKTPQYTKYKEKYQRDWDDWAPVVGGFLIFLFSIVLICATYDLLKITLAPDLWLFEYAARLLRAAK